MCHSTLIELYKFCYLNDVLFLVLLTCCSKLEIVICSDVELGRYGTGTGSGTWMETGRTSNRIMNSPQETSTRSRRGKHRKLGRPNGWLPLFVALPYFFGSVMSLTMVDTLRSVKYLWLFHTRWYETSFCLTYVTKSESKIEHFAQATILYTYSGSTHTLVIFGVECWL